MWPNPQDTTDLVTFAEEILNGKLYFWCRAVSEKMTDQNIRPLTDFAQIFWNMFWSRAKSIFQYLFLKFSPTVIKKELSPTEHLFAFIMVSRIAPSTQIAFTCSKLTIETSEKGSGVLIVNF